MRIAVGADHNGYALKKTMADLLRSLGHDVVDVGAHNMDPSDDYPDFAGALALTVASGEAERESWSAAAASGRPWPQTRSAESGRRSVMIPTQPTRASSMTT